MDLAPTTTNAESTDRWVLEPDAAIAWHVGEDARLPHEDHIEMSGRLVSVIVPYGTDERGRLRLSRHVVWPTLRPIPNDTNASLSHTWGSEARPEVHVDGRPIGEERVQALRFDGVLTIETATDVGVSVRRVLFPTRAKRIVLERWTVTNASESTVTVSVSPFANSAASSGVYGDYVMEARSDWSGDERLQPGASRTFAVTFAGRLASEQR